MVKTWLLVGGLLALLAALFGGPIAALAVGTISMVVTFVAWKPSPKAFDPGRPEDWYKAGTAISHGIRAGREVVANSGAVRETALAASRLTDGLRGYHPTGPQSNPRSSAAGAPLIGIPADDNQGGYRGSPLAAPPRWKRIANDAMFFSVGIFGLLIYGNFLARAREPIEATVANLIDPVSMVLAGGIAIALRRAVHYFAAWPVAAFLVMTIWNEVHFQAIGGHRVFLPLASLVGTGLWLGLAYLIRKLFSGFTASR
ncbi:hypothetical protein [Dongia sp.]|uniref:hypothetical protein n=1 Tax=Dongia sp. TaxID=1977262 RepID=UPI0035B4C5C1